MKIFKPPPTNQVLPPPTQLCFPFGATSKESGGQLGRKYRRYPENLCLTYLSPTVWLTKHFKTWICAQMLQIADHRLQLFQLAESDSQGFSRKSTVNECLIQIARIEFETPVSRSQGFHSLVCYKSCQFAIGFPASSDRGNYSIGCFITCVMPPEYFHVIM